MKLRSALAAATAALLLAGGAQAASYNATSSFNGTSTGGAFSYGTGTGTFNTLGTFTSFSTTSADCAGNVNFLCANDGALVPGIGKVIDGGQATFQTVVVPSDTLWVHPGTDVQSEIVFTAPTAGSYNFAATIGRLDTTHNGNGIDAYFQNITGTYLDQHSIYGANGETLSFERTLTSGQQITFAVNNHGDYTYDSTAVDLNISGPDAISAAPEPGAWALMMLGVGAIGAMLGYRKRVIVDHKEKLAAIG